MRRYLEQRREAGETELVLDSLSVEDALQLIGAAGGSQQPSRREESPRNAPMEPSSGTTTPETGTGDWRAALRALDVVPPGAPPPRSVPPQPRSAPPTPSNAAPPPTEANSAPPPIGGGRLGFDAPAAPPESNVASPGALADLPPGITVGSASHELFGGPASPWTTMDDVVRAVSNCTLCPLSREARNPVPGEGSLTAGLMCVGEAPGATEDELGRPFVGQAGQLLTKILAAIQLAREDVYICNVLKHRPPGNRNPLPSEVEACSPYLIRQIEIIRPKVIVAFGTFAAQTLLNTKEAIGKLRGRIHRYYGVPLVVTYHPAALLRNPAWKRPTWEDVQLARRLLDRTRPEP
ncbi:MAG: uracil-DNA glycosylase family protein [Gemmatimonadaceae bacterium]